MEMIVFIYGLVFGSFFNVVGLRLPEGKSIVAPRSACPTCGHTLQARELIPLFSYLFQRGKCHNCGSRISLLYPIMELITASLFTYGFIRTGFQLETILSLTLISLFMIIFVSDYEYMIIPDKVLLFFAGVFLVGRAIFPLDPWWDSIAGATVGFVLLLLVAIVSRGGMGGGDIKLFALIGFVLGLKGFLLSFFLSTLLGTIGGLAGMVLGKVKKGKPFPFGPFIVVGTLLTHFYGDIILQWYYSFF